MRKLHHAVVAFIGMLCLSGCVMMPHLKEYKDFSTNTAPSKNCRTGDLNLTEAQDCVLQVADDMSSLLDEGGQYKRSVAYALLGTGTAAATVIAFKRTPTDALKGIGVGTGALLGLNSVVNPDKQREALRAGIKALMCVYSAASVAQAVAASAPRGLSSYIANFADRARYAGVEPTVLPLAIRAAADASGVKSAADKAVSVAPLTLSLAAIQIRNDVQDRLDDVGDLSTLAQTQQKNVTALIGEIARNSGSARSSITALQKAGAAPRQLTEDVNAATSAGSVVDPIMDQCVDPATRRVLEGG